MAGAIQQIQERAIESRLRDLRGLIAEAERRGDFAELAVLTQKKLELDRALRQLHNQSPRRNDRLPAQCTPEICAKPARSLSASN